MVLVDTSVWIDHLRRTNDTLSQLLGANQVLIHPMIIGELACGNLRNRPQLLELWQQLPMARQANHPEVLHTIEQHQWMGKGIGYIDSHLLASSLLTPGTLLWTQDVRLRNLAQKIEISFNPPS